MNKRGTRGFVLDREKCINSWNVWTRGRETRANTKCISVGCMTNSFQAFAIDWPLVLTKTGHRVQGKAKGEGNDNDRASRTRTGEVDSEQKHRSASTPLPNAFPFHAIFASLGYNIL